ncbi:MAG TPA: hypothetical protein VMT50_09610, partial [Steroidobacteraceae bacterium]|nr:hypothetical protein [Steroidobacteraceae bacterium]
YDFMLGASYTRQLWTYTLGGVQMNKASTRNPMEWGQNNTATFLDLGAYRQMPEIYKNVQLYGTIGRIIYGHQGPAPLSMPSNISDGNVDPRVSRSGNIFTIGANINF